MRFLVLPFSRTLDAPPARHTEHVARPFSIADNRSLLADAVHCRHGSKLMAVPRGVLGLTAMPPRPVGRLMRPPTRTRAKRGPRRGSMCGGDRAPSAPVFAAVEADARPNGRHAALHDAERDARCAGSLCLPAREVAHAERRWRMHCGSKTPLRGGSAAAPAGEEGTLLAAGPREARSYLMHGQQHLNVFPKHSPTQSGCSQ